MNNTTVQTLQVTGTLSALPKSFSALNANDIGNASASFLKLLTGVQGAGGEAALATQLKKEAETLAAQMNAEMLTLNPLLAMMLAGQTAQSNLDVSQLNPTLDSLGQFQPPASSVDSSLSLELLSQLQQAIDFAGTSVANGSGTTDFSAAFQAIRREGEAALLLGSNLDGTSVLQGQSQFDRAVSLAQQLLGSTGETTTETAELNLEDLQKKVDSGAFLPQLTGAVSTDATVDVSNIHSLNAQNIFGQIKASVTQHAEEGVTDFTIKLTPEGLGEITVKLLEDSGKITLSLAASNAHVQRLLSGELHNLRDIMRPYNVEVAQVVQTNAPQNMDMQQQFSQQFSQHSHTGHRQSSFFAHNPNYGEIDQTGDPISSVTLPDAMLDAYI